MNVHTCHACGWETKTPGHVLVVFHPCHKAGARRRLVRLPEVRATREDFVNPIYGALAANVDDVDLLRRLEEE